MSTDAHPSDRSPDLLNRGAQSYLDDWILATRGGFQTHFDLAHDVLLRCRANRVKLKRSKCRFFCAQADLLGFRIGLGMRSITADRISAINAIPIPKTRAEVRTLLGATGFLREFVPSYAALTAPLDALVSPKTPFHWTDDHAAAVTALKAALSTAPVLLLPRFDREFHLFVDASDTGHGAVLKQLSDEHHCLLPVAFYSKRHPTANSMHANRAEARAVLAAARHFDYFLHGRHFHVYSDSSYFFFLYHGTSLNRVDFRLSCL